MNTGPFTAPPPPFLRAIASETKAMGFPMASNDHLGSLLQTLAASRPGGRFLELGTGTGQALAWLAAGMNEESSLLSLDNDPVPLAIAERHFNKEPRIRLLCTDAGEWIKNNRAERFDLIFADTWAGKYEWLPETLELLAQGGIYVVDDLLPQPNWPEGHGDKVTWFLSYMQQRTDFTGCYMDWAGGLFMAVRNR